MEYRTHLIYQVYDLSGDRFASGEKDIVLPFAPYVGLTLLLDLVNFDVMRVGWSVEKQSFTCCSDVREKIPDSDDEFPARMKDMIHTAKLVGFTGFTIYHNDSFADVIYDA